MIKNFFKNNPIHKKIVPFLDVFFLFKPLNFFSYWPIICIGMYLPLFLSNNSPLFITDFNYQFFCLFISLSLILCCYNVKKQLLDLNSSKRNVINLVKNKYSEDFIYNMVKYLLFFISEIASNLILYPRLFALKISLKFMFCIPSVNILFLDILLLKAIDDKILIFAAASSPFKSDKGLVSAKPMFCAFLSTS